MLSGNYTYNIEDKTKTLCHIWISISLVQVIDGYNHSCSSVGFNFLFFFFIFSAEKHTANENFCFHFEKLIRKNNNFPFSWNFLIHCYYFFWSRWGFVRVNQDICRQFCFGFNIWWRMYMLGGFKEKINVDYVHGLVSKFERINTISSRIDFD